MNAPAKSPPLLAIRELQHTYDERQVLAIRHLTLARGTIALLSGANGSGKSTLLRIIAGLLAPTRCAEFSFAGAARAQPPAAVYLHQTPYLFSTTVRANVEYGLRCCRLPLANAADAMQWAGISDCANSHVADLSGGERRRVALARVRALHPALYLLDEPLTHLDDNGKQRVLALINQLHKEGATAIISSHHGDLPATSRWRLADGELHSD